jgi:hypothetical protein
VYVRHQFVRALVVPVAILMEIQAEVLGAWDYYVRGRNPYIWPVAPTTKKLR